MAERIQDCSPEYLPLRCWHVVVPVVLAAVLVLTSYCVVEIRWLSTSREVACVIQRDMGGGIRRGALVAGMQYRTHTYGDVQAAQKKHLTEREGDGLQTHLDPAGWYPWDGAFRQLVGYVTWANTEYPQSSRVRVAQGVRLIPSPLPPPLPVFRYDGITISPILLLTLTTIPLGIGLWKRMRWGSLARQGFCPGCGYDLRATPDRCPECGRIVHEPSACANIGGADTEQPEPQS